MANCFFEINSMIDLEGMQKGAKINNFKNVRLKKKKTKKLSSNQMSYFSVSMSQPFLNFPPDYDSLALLKQPISTGSLERETMWMGKFLNDFIESLLAYV